MKNKRIVFIILAVLVLYFLILLFFVNKNDDNEGYLVLDNYLNLKYYNDDYHVINRDEIEKSDVNFKAYDDSNYIGTYKSEYGSTWNLFSSSGEFKKHDGYLFAVSDNLDVNVKKIVNRKINSEDKYFIEKNYGYHNFSHLVIDEAYDVDLDDNGVLDEVVCVTNSSSYLNISSTPSNSVKDNYNLVYVVLNGKSVTIINNKDELEVDVYSVKNIFNINKNKEFDIVLERIINFDGDDMILANGIYRYNSRKNKFIKMVSNYKE